MILLIDNYDSFVHNLARQFRLLGHPTEVVRNDAITLASVRRLKPTALVLSPGPGRPSDAGVSIELVRALDSPMAILGVCLGHQVIAEAFGVAVVPAPQILHGRTSTIRHDGEGLFADLPQELLACRYHSLVVDAPSLAKSDTLIATAWSDDGQVMALRHHRLPIQGVQFHPEAILTEHGLRLLQNFLQTL